MMVHASLHGTTTVRPDGEDTPEGAKCLGLLRNRDLATDESMCEPHPVTIQPGQASVI